METNDFTCTIPIQSSVLCGNFTDQTHKLKKLLTPDWAQFFFWSPVIISIKNKVTSPKIGPFFNGRFNQVGGMDLHA